VNLATETRSAGQQRVLAGQQVAAGTGLLSCPPPAGGGGGHRSPHVAAGAGAGSRWRRPAAGPGSIWGTGRGRVP
jgi:hypothetical protein